MANTLTPIQTYTLSASTTTVTFSNIPQNYTDLKLLVSARQDNSDNNLLFRPNGATTSLSSRMLTGDGASPLANTTTTPYGLVGQTGLTASTFGSAEWTIPNYTSANYKSWSVEECNETNATTAYTRLSAGLWSSTAAITSITLVAGSSGNFVSGSTFTLYGISNGVKAAGGTVTVAGGYAYHTFTSTASLLPSVQITNAEILVIAGGGGGAGTAGGGGGAGGVLYQPYLVLKSGTTYSAVIGTGGAGTTSSIGTNGVNSLFGSYTAIGGGGGGINGTSNGAGLSGGSGGGGGYGTSSSSATGGTGTSGQGNTGGLGNSVAAGGGGGGGGAGTTGYPGSTNGTGTGGPGGYGTTTYTNWGAITNTGTNVGGTYYYAAGGGGGGAGQGGQAGVGGGGSGGPYGPTANVGSAGATNTGSGGGGTSGAYTGGAGGSGLVIVRYPLA